MSNPPAPQQVDLALRAAWVLPIEPEGLLVDHVVLVTSGRIVAVLPKAQAAREYVARETLEFDQHVLMPGLVNAHTHTAMTLLRGIADDVPLDTWLSEHIWPREARYLTPEFVEDGVALGAAEMLLGGTTCCNDMYFYPDAAARAYGAAGMRAVLGLPVLDFPTPYASDADAYLKAGLAVRDALRHAPRLSFMLAPHAPYTVGDASFEQVVTYAHQLDLPIQIHLQETGNERDEAIARTGESPLARLDRLGATGPAFVAIHAVHLAPGDFDLLAAQRCHIVHCPASNMKLASGIAPVSRLLGMGVNVAIGTDSAASNNRLDMFAEMRFASLLAKVATGDAAAVPAMTALRMATLGGARALALEASIGSLVPGKEADMIAVDVSGLGATPMYDPLSHLVHAVDRESVSDAWVAGEPVMRNRELVNVDLAAVVARARLWQHRLG